MYLLTLTLFINALHLSLSEVGKSLKDQAKLSIKPRLWFPFPNQGTMNSIPLPSPSWSFCFTQLCWSQGEELVRITSSSCLKSLFLIQSCCENLMGLPDSSASGHAVFALSPFPSPDLSALHFFPSKPGIYSGKC